MIQILASLLCVSSNYLFLKDLYFLNSFGMFLGVTIILFCLFLLISFISFIIPRFIFVYLVYLYLISASIINYFKFYYKIIFSSTLIQSIIYTDSKEVFELFNTTFFVWVVLTGIVPCIFLWIIIKYTDCLLTKRQNLSLLGFVLILGMMFSSYLIPKNLYTFRYIANSLCSLMPLNYLLSFKTYWSLEKSNNSENITDVFNFSRDHHQRENINIVLVIGESSRADRWGLNGYQRNTTPRLKKTKNLITYKEAYSLATNTPLGVEGIMKKSGNYNLSSFINIFNHLKFDTYWLSNQGARYKSINSIAMEANKHMFSDDIRISKVGNNYDMDLIPLVKDILSLDKSNMIVLHTIGSHRLYDLRYPKEFKSFNPTCVNNELYYYTNECLDVQKLGNSYDNTILYTDYFLSELISILKDSNSILIYISDHGESLGENGIYAHAYPMEVAPVEQLHIPLIIWASERFLADKVNFNKFSNASSKQTNKIDQSYIFNSILDCASIKSKAIDYSKSLCH